MATHNKRKKVTHCLRCGVPKEQNPLNRKGFCLECGLARAAESIRQMSEKRGPIYDEWVRAQKRYARNLGKKP